MAIPTIIFFIAIRNENQLFTHKRLRLQLLMCEYCDVITNIISQLY
jgi:hypothetical protein